MNIEEIFDKANDLIDTLNLIDNYQNELIMNAEEEE